MEKLNIPYPIVVEGCYDKITLESVVRGHILPTDGFGIFKKEEKTALLRRLAEVSPLIVLTDSDGAGKVIRSHISAVIPKDRLIHLYTPQIKGKEKRKDSASKEGFLGVEGQNAALLRQLLTPYATESALIRGGITKLDLFNLGLSGHDDAKMRRRDLCQKLSLPADLTAPALPDAVNILYTREEFIRLARQIFVNRE